MKAGVAWLVNIGTRLLLWRHKPYIIAVAGSVGKTSTKSAIVKVLSSQSTVCHLDGNYNTDLSAPLVLFGLKVPLQVHSPLAWCTIFYQMIGQIIRPYPYKYAVLELGIDQPGDMAALTRVIKPDLAVITAVSPEHMELLGDMKVVAKEELYISFASKSVIFSADDIDPSFIKKYLDHTKPAQSYGVAQDSDYQIANLSFGKNESSFEVKSVANQPFVTRLLGLSAIKALSVAAVVGQICNIAEDNIKKSISSVQATSGRMNKLAGKNGSIILDDSYNSSPLAAIAALEVLRTVPGKRKIAVLGSMNELGDFAEEGYEQVAQHFGAADELIFVGEQASLLWPKLVGDIKHQAFASPYEAGNYLLLAIKNNDIILVKGSQNGVFCEEVTKAILEDSSDVARLVRQSPEWMKRKKV